MSSVSVIVVAQSADPLDLEAWCVMKSDLGCREKALEKAIIRQNAQRRNSRIRFVSRGVLDKEYSPQILPPQHEIEIQGCMVRGPSK